MTYNEIKTNSEVKALIRQGNDNLGVLGYTDHSEAHCALVAQRAGSLLQCFGYPEHDVELVKIAAFLHDIGNAVNRSRHAEYGGILAYSILKQTDMPLKDAITVMTAISNHDESTGGAVDAISAALIIADKTDVRRNRVRTKEQTAFDIHDRVNYAVVNSVLSVSSEEKTITLDITLDDAICSVLDYFEIFLERMLMCRRAAEMLGCRFSLLANGGRVL